MFISPPRNTFRYTFSWLIVSALVFVPLLVWAVYDYYRSRQVEPGLAFFTAVFGLLLAYAWWWTKTRVTVHDEGISYKSPFREKDLRWDEITETRYGQQAVNAAVHFGLIGWLIAAMSRNNNKMIRSFELIGPQKITINSNIRDVEEVVRLALAAVNPRLRQDAERILNSGGTVSFGKISLSPTGVIWKSKEPIPYAALVKCKIDGAMLRIKAEGKWLDNIAVAAKKVPNIFILLDLIEAKRSTMTGKPALAIAGSSASQYL
jgi:Bacterial PH domain